MNEIMRFGLDIGSNSIGWAILKGTKEDKPTTKVHTVQHAGVRIFPNSRDAKTYNSLASERRAARSARRRSDRYRIRRKKLVQTLTYYGFWEEEKIRSNAYFTSNSQEICTNPYMLRHKALSEPVAPAEFGRILFHLNQRRGFKSNRLLGDAKENSNMKKSISDTKETMKKENARTLGEFLYNRYKNSESTRARNISTTHKAEYTMYFDRSMYEEEFEILWNTQSRISKHASLYTQECKEKLHNCIFHQRPLQAQEVGWCLFEEHESRARNTLPSMQLLRIYQDVCHTTYQHDGKEPQEISIEQRDALVKWLATKQSPSKPEDIAKQIKRISNLSGDLTINFQRAENKNFKGGSTAVIFSKLLGKECWNTWTLEHQDTFIQTLHNPKYSDEETVETLQEQFGIDENIAQQCLDKYPELESGYGHVSSKAAYKLLKAYQGDKILSYDKAVKKAGYGDHRMEYKHGYKILPYYGEILQRYTGKKSGKKGHSDQRRYGRISNPTVHVGLNQVQLVINELIRRFGKPDEIIVELLRELPYGEKKYREANTNNKKRQDENEKIRKELRQECGIHRVYSEDIQKYRLWQELSKNCHERRCPYSGNLIGIHDLMSNKIEVDHILPISKTLDNSLANKTVCFAEANREKKEQTPHQAWGATDQWHGIYARAQLLPNNKRWRFDSTAMQRFEQEHDFIDRQLESSQYLAKVTRYYLEALSSDEHKIDIWVTPGRLTSWLTHDWGLYSILKRQNKNRDDHRNHAIDAIVVACTDRNILQRVARKSTQSDYGTRAEQGNRKIASEPWNNFRSDVEKIVDTIVVSYKNDRSREGKLLKETAYGLPKNYTAPTHAAESEPIVGSYQIDLHTMKDQELNKIITREKITEGVIIANPKTRSLLQKYANEHPDNLKAAIENCSKQEKTLHNIQHVKCLKKVTIIAIKNTAHGYYKGYESAGNWAMELYANNKGTWCGEVIPRYYANQKNYISLWRKNHPAKPMVMRLHINDLLILDNPQPKSQGNDATTKIIMRVCKLDIKGRITLAQHAEANVDARNRDKSDEFSYVVKTPSTLQKLQAQKIHVSPTGLISCKK